ncbi:LutC/YkgG family protein [Rubrobacter indicoceani]|uniref:LutC/YkgG family protein n=1 Tax=Rubrobacter indicoceani TaxID=2051957 RepID=UPI000E5BDA17|nr:lactate utilization protein C [Rubrobacter indicoceani]
MTSGPSAREEILARIRRATSDVPKTERPQDVSIERGYRTETDASPEETVATFCANVAEYRATVHRTTQAELARKIDRCLGERGIRRLAIPHDLPEAMIPWSVEVLRDDPRSPLSNADLDDADGVLTGCAIGVAQTGTIILDAGAGQGRRAITLLPDYHLCVVREEQVVGLVPEAIAELQHNVGGEGRAVTFISGPSATSDIELERVEGVHGPRTLEVIVVSG